MISRILLWLTVWSVPLLAHADARLSIRDFAIIQGEKQEVFIEMDNTAAVRALQFRIQFPEGISIAERPELVAERIGGATDEFGEWQPSVKTVGYNSWEDGSYMIIVNAEDGIPFSGNEGAIISLQLQATENLPIGEYAITMSDIEIVYADGENFTSQGEFDSNATVLSRIYKLTYLLDGEVYFTDSVAYKTTLTPIEAPTKEGHTFSGWNGLPETMPAKDVEVNGTFSVNSYLVSYVVDGVVYHTDSVAYGSTIVVPNSPVKEGYSFNGWTNVPKTMPAKDIIIEGTFTNMTYLVTYLIDGEVYYTDSVTYGESISVIAEPIREGYTFSGWSEVPATMPAENLVVNGNFTINSYTLTYIVDGETYYMEEVVYGASISIIEEPTKAGYTFSGWSNIPTTMPAEDVDVIGAFTFNSVQTDKFGVVYTLNEQGTGFELSYLHDDVNVDNYIVPTELFDVPVTSICDEAFKGYDLLKSIVIPSTIKSIGSRVFKDCHNLLVVEWNSSAPVDADCFDVPEMHGNLLVFVADASTPVSYEGNVVVDGKIDELELIDGQPFRNPYAFTATKVSYTHEFRKETKIGESCGWEALVLPFMPEQVESETKGALLPFGDADFTNALPYWLAELQGGDSFVHVQKITANSPFIMQLPNSDAYDDAYNVTGRVTFSASNALVHATNADTLSTSDGYQLRTAYEGAESANGVFALNDEEYTALNGATYSPGGVFVMNSRDVRPFEAYVYSERNLSTPYLCIGAKMPTDINNVVFSTSDEGWYTLQGVRLTEQPRVKGLYIHRGKVVVIE